MGDLSRRLRQADHHCRLDRGIDDGAIVAALRLALDPGMGLHPSCAPPVTAVASRWCARPSTRSARPGRSSPAQRAKGRYYSFMPAGCSALRGQVRKHAAHRMSYSGHLGRKR